MPKLTPVDASPKVRSPEVIADNSAAPTPSTPAACSLALRSISLGVKVPKCLRNPSAVVPRVFVFATEDLSKTPMTFPTAVSTVISVGLNSAPIKPSS